MIASKGRESRRGKLRTAKLMEQLYKEKKCRDCSVVVTKMDFAKILGKFTKVKIQYESSSPRSKKSVQVSTPKLNARLKNNENGMVQIHRNAINKKPTKTVCNQKNNKLNNTASPQNKNNKLNSTTSSPSLQNNVLKEKNVLKTTTPPTKSYSRKTKNLRKQYAIIFNEPTDNNNKNDTTNELCLADLLPHINKNMLPSAEWCIDYFPKDKEPDVDKVYDRIAAELEDLMCSDKPIDKNQKPTETKVDEFPSIMDILNDNSAVNNVETKHETNLEFKSNLDSSDVEAMLLGNPDPSEQAKEPEPMEVDNTNVNKPSNNAQDKENEKPKNEEENSSQISLKNDIDNPGSPSILDDTLQKGIEEQIEIENTPNKSVPEVLSIPKEEKKASNDVQLDMQSQESEQPVNGVMETPKIDSSIFPITQISNIKYVTFKKSVDGKCSKSVTCPKTLKYSIELDNKSVEFLGAPKYISSVEDLQVLLQIVHESDLHSLYVLHK